MFPLSYMLKGFIKKGSLEVIDADGKTHTFGGKADGPKVKMKLTDPKLYKTLFTNPELAAGEAYMDGTMSFPGSSLRDFLTLFSDNRRSLGQQPYQRLFGRVQRSFKRLQQANPVGQAQKNVAHHYDLGNDFYKLFLDTGMQYSCAYFQNDDNTLEDAQLNKLRLIASKLRLGPGQKVLDIGSGWGDMALYIGAMTGSDVTGVTLSKEQHALAPIACALNCAITAISIRSSTASSRSACSNTLASATTPSFSTR
jgi:cyclopropane-fatty-acyl-phospholipid synthase